MDFGVLSTANIGVECVIPAIESTEHEVTAIASRSTDRAEAVASDLGIGSVYGSYEDLITSSGVDAVYNPLPNSLHAEWTRTALEEGLHVICEKPLTPAPDEALALHETADSAGTLMEGLMYAYHPRTERVFELVENRLDDVRHVTARFSFHLDWDEDIRLDPELDGGSMMDVGYYPIDFAREIFGRPDRVSGRLRDSRDSGTDTSMNAILEYDSGTTAQVSSSFDTARSQFYRVEAANGWIAVTDAFDTPQDVDPAIVGEIDGESIVETFDPVDQYRLEVEHFATCVTENQTPRTDALRAASNMAIVDSIRKSDARGTPVEVRSHTK